MSSEQGGCLRQRTLRRMQEQGVPRGIGDDLHQVSDEEIAQERCTGPCSSCYPGQDPYLKRGCCRLPGCQRPHDSEGRHYL
jgi:hypothetical protein